MAASSVEDFKQCLIDRFGTLVAAWRTHLDMDGNGRLSFGELCAALRGISYRGNVQQLWNELDKDDNAMVDLDELDPEADAALSGFREYLIERFGSLELAWSKGFDTEKLKRIELPHFLERCSAIGYAVDEPNGLKKLFKWLVSEKGKRSIVLDDFGALLIGVHSNERTAIWYGRKFGSSTRENKNKADYVQEDHRKMLASTLEEFKALLVETYGSIVAAWRALLDSDGNGRISVSELHAALRKLSFRGDAKQIWKSLDKDASGLISLDELDPEADAAFRHFREHLVGKFRGLKPAWLRGFDIQNTHRIDLAHFLERCSEIGYEVDDPNVVSLKKLFKLLLPERGKKHLVQEDFETLLIGVSKKDWNMTWHGRDFGMSFHSDGTRVDLK
jgi:Ca2+-binding EF-hand superfamily protein